MAAVALGDDPEHTPRAKLLADLAYRGGFLGLALDNTTMTGLNKQVEVDNLKVADVAKAFLTAKGLL